MTGPQPLYRHLGRVIVGLGLMVLALNLTVGASAQLRLSSGLEIVVAVLIGAGLAWLFHSGVALVLLVVGFAAGGVVSPAIAFPLVLGANIGSGIIPAVLTLRSRREARRIPLGNLLFRLAAVIAVLPLLSDMMSFVAKLDTDPARQVANFHTLFNLILLLVGLPLVHLMARFVECLLPAAEERQEGGPRHLKKDVSQTPALALAGATREALRMADIVEEMLVKVVEAFEPYGRNAADQLGDLNSELQKLHEAIKLYLADLTGQPLGETEGRRCRQLLSFTTNLRHVGDIIGRNLRKSAQKKQRNKLSFSEEGWSDLRELHGRVSDHLQLALSAFVSGNPTAARQLIKDKNEIRLLEEEVGERHLERLRYGRAESIETSSMHIDMARDLKRINSHFTAIGYAVLSTESVSSCKKKRAQ